MKSILSFLMFPILVGMGSTATAAVLPAGMDVTLTAAQTISNRDDARPTTDLTVDAYLQLAPRHKLRLVQGITKHYEIAQIGGNEIEATDTSLSWYWRLADDWNSFEVSLRTVLTAPLSLTSQRDGVITRPMLQLQLTRRFFDGALVVSYRPHVQYHWNRFTGSPGGTPLRRISLGHSVVAEGHPLSKVVLALSAVAAYHFPETVAAGPQSPKGSYEIDMSAGYELSPSVVARLGMLQSDSFLKAGRLEVFLYDPAQTRFYAALDIAI